MQDEALAGTKRDREEDQRIGVPLRSLAAFKRTATASKPGATCLGSGLASGTSRPGHHGHVGRLPLAVMDRNVPFVAPRPSVHIGGVENVSYKEFSTPL
jgi:hypothetical protein